MIAVTARELKTLVVHLRQAKRNRTLCKQRGELACTSDLNAVTCPWCLKWRASQIIYFKEVAV